MQMKKDKFQRVYVESIHHVYIFMILGGLGQMNLIGVANLYKEGKMSTILVNTTVNAGRLLVKMAELNQKYGRSANTKRVHSGPRINLLTGQAE